jgi:hypothetical protein
VEDTPRNKYPRFTTKRILAWAGWQVTDKTSILRSMVCFDALIPYVLIPSMMRNSYYKRKISEE